MRKPKREIIFIRSCIGNPRREGNKETALRPNARAETPPPGKRYCKAKKRPCGSARRTGLQKLQCFFWDLACRIAYKSQREKGLESQGFIDNFPLFTWNKDAVDDQKHSFLDLVLRCDREPPEYSRLYGAVIAAAPFNCYRGKPLYISGLTLQKV